eukprot:2402752-Ditylum_brightwellii.AAC.1
MPPQPPQPPTTTSKQEVAISSSSSSPNLKPKQHTKPIIDIVLFTTTYFDSPTDLRCRIAQSTLRNLNKFNIPTIVVDASPPSSGVYEALQATDDGKGMIQVHKQVKNGGGKGVALREAMTHALQLPGVTQNTWLCFQEPEKTHMAYHWNQIFRNLPIDLKNSGIVIPKRTEKLFQETYPIEQFHEEMFGNMYLDTVAQAALSSSSSSSINLPPIDWLFGPFALRAKHAPLWLSYA